MPRFGKESEKQIATCTPIAQAILRKAIKVYDFSVLCGYRGKAAQEKAFAEGKSKAKWGQSDHNIFPSPAFDVAPYFRDKPHIRWDRRDEFVHLAGIIIGAAAAVGFLAKWGGNWDKDVEVLTDQDFDDLPHIVIIGSI